MKGTTLSKIYHQDGYIAYQLNGVQQIPIPFFDFVEWADKAGFQPRTFPQWGQLVRALILKFYIRDMDRDAHYEAEDRELRYAAQEAYHQEYGYQYSRN